MQLFHAAANLPTKFRRNIDYQRDILCVKSHTHMHPKMFSKSDVSMFRNILNMFSLKSPQASIFPPKQPNFLHACRKKYLEQFDFCYRITNEFVVLKKIELPQIIFNPNCEKPENKEAEKSEEKKNDRSWRIEQWNRMSRDEIVMSQGSLVRDDNVNRSLQFAMHRGS